MVEGTVLAQEMHPENVPLLVPSWCWPRTDSGGGVRRGLGESRLSEERLDLKVITENDCHTFWPNTSWQYL